MHFWKKKDNLIISGCVILFFAGLMMWQERGAVHADLPGKPSPALTVGFLDKDYKTHTLAQFKGKPCIVVLWATWCPACVKKMGALNAFAKKFEEKGGHVIALSEDMNGIEKVQNYYAQNKYDNLTIYIDDNGGVMGTLRVSGLPTAIFLNAKGEEVDRVVGGIDWESSAVHQMIKSSLGVRM